LKSPADSENKGRDGISEWDPEVPAKWNPRQAWVLTAPAETLRASFAALMVLAFHTGIGDGIFSGYMPSTSYFFPKKKQGLALGAAAIDLWFYARPKAEFTS